MRWRLTAWIALGFIGFAVVGYICSSYTQEQVSFRAPVAVTIGGLYDPGRLVSFAANKLNKDGSVETGSRLVGDRFTDFLGQADFQFGYKLDYDNEGDVFAQGVRVVASVDYSGALYTDTVYLRAPFAGPLQAYVLDTLRIDLPAR